MAWHAQTLSRVPQRDGGRACCQRRGLPFGAAFANSCRAWPLPIEVLQCLSFSLPCSAGVSCVVRHPGPFASQDSLSSKRKRPVNAAAPASAMSRRRASGAISLVVVLPWACQLWACGGGFTGVPDYLHMPKAPPPPNSPCARARARRMMTRLRRPGTRAREAARGDAQHARRRAR